MIKIVPSVILLFVQPEQSAAAPRIPARSSGNAHSFAALRSTKRVIVRVSLSVGSMMTERSQPAMMRIETASAFITDGGVFRIRCLFLAALDKNRRSNAKVFDESMWHCACRLIMV